MEATTEGPPAGTSNGKLEFIQFPRINDEERPKITTFPRSLFNNCFSFLSHKVPPRIQVHDRKILRTPTILTFSHSKMNSSIDASPYKWPHDNSFDPKTTALVIIDMQQDCEYFLSPQDKYSECNEEDIQINSSSHSSVTISISVPKSFTDSPHFHLPSSDFSSVATIPSVTYKLLTLSSKLIYGWVLTFVQSALFKAT